MRQILYDNVNLNIAPYAVTEIDNESVADRDVYEYALARERGSVVVSSEYRAKTITLKGIVYASTESAIDTHMDTIREVLSRPGRNLDVTYGSGLRRYRNCFVRMNPINKRQGYTTKAEWSAAVLVPEGIGIDTTTTTATASGVTAATYNGTVTINGNTKTKPTITLTFTAVSGTLNAVSLQNGNTKIDIAQTIVTNDVLVIDCANKQVRLNGVAKDYTGFFPEWTAGTNSYTIVTNGTSRTYDISIQYYPTWL